MITHPGTSIERAPLLLRFAQDEVTYGKKS